MSRAALDAPGVTLDAERLIALRHVARTVQAEVALAASPGGFASRKRGRGLEIADVREYQTGDDLRQLDRGTTARTGRLHVRVFQEDRDRIVLLVADFRRPMFWGITRALRSVAAAEALALIGWTVVSEGGRVGLLALTGGDAVAVPPRGRDRGMLQVIGGMVTAHREALTRAGQDRSEVPPLDADLARVGRLAPAGAEIVIASGFDAVGPSFADRLGQTAQRRTIRLLHISALHRAGVPPGTYPIRLPNGETVRVRLGAETLPEDAAIDGWPALTLAAADAPESMARRLAHNLAQADRPEPAR